jgi:hypothetical protein
LLPNHKTLSHLYVWDSLDAQSARNSRENPVQNTEISKSFIACAMAQKAFRDGYSALYTRAVSLFRDLALARADGSLRNLLARLSRVDVLVIDDWSMAPLAETERRDFWNAPPHPARWGHLRQSLDHLASRVCSPQRQSASAALRTASS